MPFKVKFNVPNSKLINVREDDSHKRFLIIGTDKFDVEVVRVAGEPSQNVASSIRFTNVKELWKLERRLQKSNVKFMTVKAR